MYNDQSPGEALDMGSGDLIVTLGSALNLLGLRYTPPGLDRNQARAILRTRIARRHKYILLSLYFLLYFAQERPILHLMERRPQ